MLAVPKIVHIAVNLLMDYVYRRRRLGRVRLNNIVLLVFFLCINIHSKNTYIYITAKFTLHKKYKNKYVLAFMNILTKLQLVSS